MSSPPLRIPACCATVLVCMLAGLAASAPAWPSEPAGVPRTPRGRGVASAQLLARNPAELVRLGAHWAYDWSADAPRATPGLDWVPMVWGAGSVTPRVLAALGADRRNGRARALLAFNEPDSTGQSNMSVARAIALWPALERTGLRLGSPAPAVAGDGWLARFMAAARARRLRVDFLALHVYQDFTDPGAVGELRRELVAIHHEYRRPLWITEIGTLDIRAWGSPMRAAPTEARAVVYERRLFAMLDGLPFLERYAWFTDRCSDGGCPTSALLARGARVTAVGRAYAAAP